LQGGREVSVERVQERDWGIYQYRGSKKDTGDLSVEREQERERETGGCISREGAIERERKREERLRNVSKEREQESEKARVLKRE
jgi:hypothetical protein